MISPRHMTWLEARKISPEIAVRCSVHTDDGDVLAFPYVEGEAIVAEKYRGPNKKFWQREGGKRTFYNANVLDDSALERGEPLVICEGELDCLAVLTAGYPFAVSVPDGAVAQVSKEEPSQAEESTGKFEFLWNNRDRLRRIKRFVIATDGDGPGNAMAEELVRRLGAARCARMEFPAGTKDANDILVKFGAPELISAIKAAKEYPIHGLYDFADFTTEDLKLYNIGIDGWSQRLQMPEKGFVVVTGPTSHGKTSFSIQVAANLARDHKFKFAVFSSEQEPSELRNLLRTLYCGGAWSRDLVERADMWIRDHFKLIFCAPDMPGSWDQDATLQWVIDRAEDAVLRYGVNGLIIDPWNELEHPRDKGESVTDYTGRSIRNLKRFMRQYRLLIMMCVHPTKDFVKATKDGKPRAVTLYDCEGSSHWANKADIGLVVERDNARPNGAKVTVAKARYRKFGPAPETYDMKFDLKSQRFVSDDLFAQ